MRFKVVLEPEEDGGYSVHCPALKGCHSQGETEKEALANIKEAIEGYLLALNEKIKVDSKKAKVEEVVV
jgi:predicted RNase H-like HicB family nuclease